MINTQHILWALFGAKKLDDVSVMQLKELVEDYPSFNAAHYLLSKKLQREKRDEYLTATQKTGLHFNNPFWLQWLLQNTQEEEIEKIEESTIIQAHQPGKLALNDTMAKPPDDGETTIPSQQDPASEPVQETKEEGLSFEPYYTIDYFASQGIKFIQEENPNDKLGKQLKSFTDWLKTMKRLPQATVDTAGDETIEATIESIAAHSIEEKDVITETMAEVLARQGKNEKAAELYNKLSLLNPAKRAYFAAKIEQLKVH